MNINLLTSVDTPTISNALDLFRGDRSSEGFTKFPVICSNIKLKPVIGVARTARIVASKKSDLDPNSLNKIRLDYYEYMAKKTHDILDNFCVIQDMDWPSPIGSFWGEVNVSIHKGLGLCGVLTNGLLRDLDDIDKDFMVLANGIGPSHAFVHVLEFDSEISICGLKIKPNDIIHADKHGAVVIPEEAIEILPRAIQFMRDKEDIVISASKKEDFNFDKLKVAWDKANKLKF